MKKITFTVFIFTTSILLYSQNEDLRKDEKFFNLQLKNYKTWLDSTDLSKILTIGNSPLIIEPNLLIAKIDIPNLKNWQYLSEASRKKFKLPLDTLLFNKLVFFMDLKKSQVKIKVKGEDANIHILYEKNRLTTEIEKTLGYSDKAVIQIKKLKGLEACKIQSIDTFEVVLNRVDSGLKLFFDKQRKPKIDKYKYKSIPNENELKIVINNVLDVILDENYFERIVIQFYFTKSPKNVSINYTVDGKYGAGLFWAPRRSDFYPMDAKYAEQLKDFSDEIKSIITKSLKTK